MFKPQKTTSTKQLHMLAYSVFYLHLTWNQFHGTLHPMEDGQKTCPMYVKLTSFAFVMSEWNSLGLGAIKLMPPDASGLA